MEMSISWSPETTQLIRSSPGTLLIHEEARALCYLHQTASGFLIFPPGIRKSQRGRRKTKKQTSHSMQKAMRHLLETKLSVLSVERTKRETTRSAAEQREGGLIPNPPQTHFTTPRSPGNQLFIIFSSRATVTGNCSACASRARWRSGWRTLG